MNKKLANFVILTNRTNNKMLSLNKSILPPLKNKINLIYCLDKNLYSYSNHSSILKIITSSNILKFKNGITVKMRGINNNKM